MVLSASWSLEISNFVRSGENSLEILVVNMAANVFADAPSPYMDSAQGVAGLFGPVLLVWLEMADS